MSCVKGSTACRPEEMFWIKSDFIITLIFAKIALILITLSNLLGNASTSDIFEGIIPTCALFIMNF